MAALLGLSLVHPEGWEYGATITPFGPGRSAAPREIADPSAALSNRIAVSLGDPSEPAAWRPAKLADVLGHPLTLSGVVRAIAVDLGPLAPAARALLGDLLATSAQIGSGVSARTLALAIGGDAALIAPPYVPLGGASALRTTGKALTAVLGNVSDGTPTGLLSVKPLTASGRKGKGDLTVTIRRPRDATAADLEASGLTWDHVMASAMALDRRDAKEGVARIGGETWLGISIRAMERVFEQA